MYYVDAQNRHNSVSLPCVEADSNTPTVLPASRTRRRKGTQCLGYNWDTPFLGGYKYGYLAPMLGEYRIWDSKIWSLVPEDTDQRMTALAKARSNCKWQTHPLITKGAPHQQTRKCVTVTKIWFWAPDGCLTPRKTGRLTVGRNMTLTQFSLRLRRWRRRFAALLSQSVYTERTIPPLVEEETLLPRSDRGHTEIHRHKSARARSWTLTSI
jgi:hypothetical protein